MQIINHESGESNTEFNHVQIQPAEFTTFTKKFYENTKDMYEIDACSNHSPIFS